MALRIPLSLLCAVLLATLYAAHYWAFGSLGSSPFTGHDAASSASEFSQAWQSGNALEWVSTIGALLFVTLHADKVVMALLAALVVNNNVRPAARRAVSGLTQHSRALQPQGSESDASQASKNDGVACPTIGLQVILNDETEIGARRIIQHACALVWDRKRLFIQIVDCSLTTAAQRIVDDEVARQPDAGMVNIQILRRPARDGANAACLNEALDRLPSEVKYMMLLTPDSLPAPTSLQDCLPYLESDPRVAVVQLRPTYVNVFQSVVSMTQFVNCSFYCCVEQTVRSYFGWYSGCLGPVSVIRLEALKGVGGWDDTDVHIGWNATLSMSLYGQGWSSLYLPSVEYHSELPVTYTALRQRPDCAADTIAPLFTRSFYTRIWRSSYLSVMQKVATTWFYLRQITPLVNLLMLVVLLPVRLVWADHVLWSWLYGVAVATIILSYFSATPSALADFFPYCAFEAGCVFLKCKRCLFGSSSKPLVVDFDASGPAIADRPAGQHADLEMVVPSASSNQAAQKDSTRQFTFDLGRCQSSINVDRPDNDGTASNPDNHASGDSMLDTTPQLPSWQIFSPTHTTNLDSSSSPTKPSTRLSRTSSFSWLSPCDLQVIEALMALEMLACSSYAFGMVHSPFTAFFYLLAGLGLLTMIVQTLVVAFSRRATTACGLSPFGTCSVFAVLFGAIVYAAVAFAPPPQWQSPYCNNEPPAGISCITLRNSGQCKSYPGYCENTCGTCGPYAGFSDVSLAHPFSNGAGNIFLNGVNGAWICHGCDFGHDDWYFDVVLRPQFERDLRNINRNGGNFVRYWVYGSFESRQVTRWNNATGKLEWVSPNVIVHLQTLLRAAQKNNVYVLLTLVNGVLDLYEPRVVLDVEVMQSFIDLAIVPLVQALKECPAVLGYDIINEPEGMVTDFNNAWVKPATTMTVVQRFIGRVAHAIHQADQKSLVTTGAQYMFSLHSGASAPPTAPIAHNYYNDVEIIRAARDGAFTGYDEAFMDFYSVHFYDDHGFLNWRTSLINVLEHDRSVYGVLDKPLVVAEVSLKGIPWGGSTANIYRMAYDMHWAGVAGWHLLAAGKATDTYDELMGAMLSLHYLPGCEAIHLNYLNVPLPAKTPRPPFTVMQSRIESLLLGAVTFWKTHGMDIGYGGVVGTMDRKGKPIAPFDKSVVQLANHLWSLATWFQKREESLAVKASADTLYVRLLSHYAVPVGLYTEFVWSVNRTGNVVDTRNIIYAQAAVMDALAMYGSAFNNSVAIQQALNLFRSIDLRAHDATNGGYSENNDGGLLTNGAKRSLKTHRRLLQSLLNVYAVTFNIDVKARIAELAQVVSHVLESSKPSAYASEQYDDRWVAVPESSATEQVSVGAELQTVQLLLQASSSGALSATLRANITAQAVALGRSIFKSGYDRVHGGFHKSINLDGTVSASSKLSWVQAEAIHALWLMFGATNDEQYGHLMNETLTWIETHQVDHVYPQSEWFAKVSTDGVTIIDDRKGTNAKSLYDIVHALVPVANDVRQKFVMGQVSGTKDL